MDFLEELIKTKKFQVPDTEQQYRNIFRHYRGKKVESLEGDPRPLLNDPKEFYLKPPTEGFLQGDLLSGLSVPFINEDGEAVVSDAAFCSMVLSNECDAEYRKNNYQAYLRLCPVFRETELFELEPGLASPDRKGNLQANRYTEYFWMPRFEEQPLIADLSLIFSVDLPHVHQQMQEDPKRRLASLSEDAHSLLRIKLAWFFLRPTTDSRRVELGMFD